MPVKKLPKELVERLKHDIERAEGREHDVYGALGKLKNIDERGIPKYAPKGSTTHMGTRVKLANISRNYPGTELVVKRVHHYRAEETVRIVQEAVRRHNQRFKPEGYEILEPNAYPIADYLVAMARAEFCVDGIPHPEIKELNVLTLGTLTSHLGTSDARTKLRGILAPLGFGGERLMEIRREVYENTSMFGPGDVEETVLTPGNLLVVGVRENKLQLVPAIDVL